MKIKTTLFTAIALGMSSYASAQVTISIPDTIDVVVANNAKPELKGGFFDASKTLILPDGENQILFIYQPYFDQGKDRVILDSDPLIATFNAQGQQLELDMPNYRNAHQASQQIRSVKWSLKDSSGNRIAVKQDKLVKEGMQIGRNLQLELVEYNRNGGKAALSGMEAAPIATKIDSKESADSTAEEMLHFWYSKADAKTKARFKAHINQQ